MGALFRYLTDDVTGESLTDEPALLAMLIVFFITTAVGLAIWFLSRRYEARNPLAASKLNLLGNALGWTGVTALIIAGCFSQNALFTRRFWLYLALLAIYAVLFYYAYYYLTQYTELERIQRQEREARRKYTPAPHTLAGGKEPTTTRTQVIRTRSSSTRRKRRAQR